VERLEAADQFAAEDGLVGQRVRRAVDGPERAVEQALVVEERRVGPPAEQVEVRAADVHRRVEVGDEPGQAAEVVEVVVRDQHPVDLPDGVAGIRDLAPDPGGVDRESGVDEREVVVRDQVRRRSQRRTEPQVEAGDAGRDPFGHTTTPPCRGITVAVGGPPVVAGGAIGPPGTYFTLRPDGNWLWPSENSSSVRSTPH
jgi:hypothetical protein